MPDRDLERRLVALCSSAGAERTGLAWSQTGGQQADATLAMAQSLEFPHTLGPAQASASRNASQLLLPLLWLMLRGSLGNPAHPLLYAPICPSHQALLAANSGATSPYGEAGGGGA